MILPPLAHFPKLALALQNGNACKEKIEVQKLTPEIARDLELKHETGVVVAQVEPMVFSGSRFQDGNKGICISSSAPGRLL